jgi:hypothetical protein
LQIQSAGSQMVPLSQSLLVRQATQRPVFGLQRAVGALHWLLRTQATHWWVGPQYGADVGQSWGSSHCAQMSSSSSHQSPAVEQSAFVVQFWRQISA